MRRRKTGGGGRVERVEKERVEGLAVAHGRLDDVPLFRKYANVARCKITEDVGLGSEHIQGLCHTHYDFRMGLSLGTSGSTSVCQRRSRTRDDMGFAGRRLPCLPLRGIFNPTRVRVGDFGQDDLHCHLPRGCVTMTRRWLCRTHKDKRRMQNTTSRLG